LAGFGGAGRSVSGQRPGGRALPSGRSGRGRRTARPPPSRCRRPGRAVGASLSAASEFDEREGLPGFADSWPKASRRGPGPGGPQGKASARSASWAWSVSGMRRRRRAEDCSGLASGVSPRACGASGKGWRGGVRRRTRGPSPLRRQGPKAYVCQDCFNYNASAGHVQTGGLLGAP
jgi:hypothetical protein